MKHTKEPWKFQKGFNNVYAVVDGLSTHITKTNSEQVENGLIEADANAKRIVACVNACAGITNEALEEGIVKEAMELFWIVSDKAVLNENNQMTYNGKTIFISDMEDV